MQPNSLAYAKFMVKTLRTMFPHRNMVLNMHFPFLGVSTSQVCSNIWVFLNMPSHFVNLLEHPSFSKCKVALSYGIVEQVRTYNPKPKTLSPQTRSYTHNPELSIKTYTTAAQRTKSHTWGAVKELKFIFHDKETLLFTLCPYYNNLF